MDKSIYKKWAPIDGLPDKLYLEGLHDDYEGFRLLLKGELPQMRMLRITFKPVLVYRNIDEGNYLKTISDNNSRSSLGTLLLVDNSDFLSWFQRVSLGIHSQELIKHYLICTPNDRIDILAKVLPKVEWLN